MRVRLQNPALANTTMGRREVYRFDADGYATFGFYDDVNEFVRFHGCKLIDLVEGDGEMEINKTFIFDMGQLVREDSTNEMVRQLNYLIREHYQAFIANNGKVLLVK